MPLFTVTVTAEVQIVVSAPSPELATLEAANLRRDLDYNDYQFNAEPLKSGSDLPMRWSGRDVPYGGGDRSITELLTEGRSA